MANKPSPEDAFYESLTMGLMKTLSNVPRILNVTCERRSPCEKVQVMNWEHRHSVYLSEDMKKFYLSTDGFNLQWSYQYAPNDTRRVGCIQFPRLIQITLLRENIEPNAAIDSQPTIKDQPLKIPFISPKTKIFELNNVNDLAKVCLVYENPGLVPPKIYLLELESLKWRFLAESFSEYLRMSIAHLGLPYWELCFSTFGLPSWTEQLFLLLAPHLLDNTEPRRGRIIQPVPEHPYNQLDPTVFRSKPKNSKQSQPAKGK